MWLDWPDPGAFWDAAFDAASKHEHPYMAFAIRSDTGRDPVLLHTFDSLLEALMADKRIADVAFVTPEETMAKAGLVRV